MNQGIKIIYWVFILWSILVTILDLKGNITLGHGMGDVYYLLCLAVLVAVVSIIYFRKVRTDNQYAALLFLIFASSIIIAFTLKLTLFRGPEYPWNGRLFLN